MAISALLVAAGYAGEEQRGGPIIGLASTAFYAFFFVLGVITAKHVDQLTALVRRTPRIELAVMLAVALGIYGAFPVVGLGVPVGKAVIGLASAALMILSIGWAGLAQVLRARPFQFVGMVSYSYFLLHEPISDLVVRLTGGPGVLPAVLTVAASLLAAWASFRLIEQPSIAIGRRLSSAISRRALPAPRAAPAAA